MINRYNKTNAKLKRGQALGQPSISLRDGCFRINRILCDMMDIKAGDGVEILHDEEAGEWYIAKSDNDGFNLIQTGGNALQFGSRLMQQKMHGYLPPAQGSTISLPVAKMANTLEGMECFAILGLLQP